MDEKKLSTQMLDSKKKKKKKNGGRRKGSKVIFPFHLNPIIPFHDTLSFLFCACIAEQPPFSITGIEDVSLMDLVKWMTGSSQIPPLGFPKKFMGCCCRPTTSTCDTTIKLPVHIDNEKAMEDMIASAVKDSYGFGLI